MHNKTEIQILKIYVQSIAKMTQKIFQKINVTDYFYTKEKIIIDGHL